MKVRALVLPTLLAAMAAGSLHAQDAKRGGWNFLVEPYLMFPNMKGEVGIADLPPASVDEDPSDIFSHLQMGAMVYFEANNGRWMFSSDLLYMDLESDLTPKEGVIEGKAQMSQVGFELAAMRRLSDWFELGISAVYNKIDADVDMTFDTVLGTSTRSVSLTEDWIDPTVVMRGTFPLGARWRAQLRGNIGGFGVGSDVFWQLQADVVYRHSDQWQFTFGYRLIDYAYDQGDGLDRFRYDMQKFGPVLKVGNSF
jgi:hypothetical protein